MTSLPYGGADTPCNCTEERVGPSGRARIVCTCPIPPGRQALRYGMKQADWRRLSREIIRRDRGVCRYCGEARPSMQADHVVAYSRGGTNDPSNLVAACSDCNRSKGGRSLEQWSGCL